MRGFLSHSMTASLSRHETGLPLSLNKNNNPYIMSSKSRRSSRGFITKGTFGGVNKLARDNGIGWKRLFLANEKLNNLKKSLNIGPNHRAQNGSQED